MDYQKHYDSLITNARSRARPEGYTERHHIIPRCMGGVDSNDNMVRLTGREHFVAHCILAKIYGGKLWKAIHRMAPSLNKTYSRLYSRARVENAKLMVSVGYRNAIALMESNRGVTARTKEKMTEDGKKGSLHLKKMNGFKIRDNKLGIFSVSGDQKSVWAKLGKGGSSNYNKNKSNPNGIFTAESRSSAGKKGIEVTRAQRYKCLECGLVSDPGGLAAHQRFKNHKGKERVV